MATIQSYWQEFTANTERVLFLQGPVGPFFARLSEYLEENHAMTAYKINFNGGDRYYYPEKDNKSLSYHGGIDEFKAFLKQYVEANEIDTIVCFGHQRIYHQIAKELCLENKEQRSFWAFEEGYLRPHYITFEKWGVNYNSRLMQKAEYYLSLQTCLEEPKAPLPMASGFVPRALLAMRYYYEMDKQKQEYAQYQHHRETQLSIYVGAWLLSGYRHFTYQFRENRFARLVEKGGLGRFFIAPLQVYNDSQVTANGRGKSVPSFIRHLLYSFAKYAPKETQLVFKHHPMDRGFNHYGALIKKLSKRYGIEGRVHYLFDVNLPTLMREAAGMVVLNSTSGLSGMIHGIPVKALGEAHYDFDGLTDQQTLAKFWKDPMRPDSSAFNAYRRYLLHKTQLNGNFYRDQSGKLPIIFSCE